LWILVARARKAADYSQSSWDDAYKRAVEENPGRADILWEWSESISGRDRQLELKVQAVAADPANVALASSAALILNALYARERRLFTQLTWRALFRPVADVLESHFEELDAPALSRLAWVYLHAGQKRDAGRAVTRGETVDPENSDIERLVARRSEGW
jgi:hypothetical protein